MILDYLIEKKNHPTVDILYSDLHPQIPTLSKTTLYNTLGLFLEKGLAMQVAIEKDEVRYDGDTSSHGHFKCRVCGGVYDFAHETALEGLPKGFLTEEAHLYAWGVCPGCSPQG